MIDPADIDRKIAQLLMLARDRYGVRAKSLDGAMRKIGRRVPSRTHADAQVLVDAAQLAGHPKLMLQADAARVQAAFEAVRAQFKAEDRADRRKGAILGTLGALSFNLIVLVVLLILFLRWQGFV